MASDIFFFPPDKMLDIRQRSFQRDMVSASHKISVKFPAFFFFFFYSSLSIIVIFVHFSAVMVKHTHSLPRKFVLQTFSKEKRLHLIKLINLMGSCVLFFKMSILISIISIGIVILVS